MKKFRIIIIFFALILTYLGNCNSVRAQQDSLQYPTPDDFLINVDFTKLIIDVGYWESWGLNWLEERPPYEVFARGRVYTNSLPFQEYPLKMVVYINRHDWLNNNTAKNGGKNKIKNNTKIYRVSEDTDPEILQKYGIGPERINYKNPKDREEKIKEQILNNPNNFLAKLYANQINKKENAVNGAKGYIPVDANPNNSGYDWNWRNNFIKIAAADNDCWIKKSIITDFGKVINFNSPMITVKDQNNQDIQVFINELAWAIQEVGVTGRNDSISYNVPSVYIPVYGDGMSIGTNFTPIVIDYSASKYTGKPQGIQLSYNLKVGVPSYSYGVILKEDWCMYGYTTDHMDVVYNAITTADGGYEAGFNSFKQTVRDVGCDYDGNIIGFVRLNKKNQGAWQSWPTATEGYFDTEEGKTPVIVTLSDYSEGQNVGHPFSVDSTTTLASGGTFRFIDLAISNVPNSPRMSMDGTVPSAINGHSLTIAPCDGEGCDPGPLPQETAVSTINIEDIFTVQKYDVVVQGNGTVFVYNSLGLLVQQINVNGEITIGTSHLPLESYVFKYVSKDGKITQSKKIVGGR